MAAVAAAGGQPPEYSHQEKDEVNFDDEELEEAKEEEAQEGANLNQPEGGNPVRADCGHRHQRNNNNRRNNRRPQTRRGDTRQGRERHAPYQRRRHHPRVGTPSSLKGPAPAASQQSPYRSGSYANRCAIRGGIRPPSSDSAAGWLLPERGRSVSYRLVVAVCIVH
jgi:hypothetical protein